MNNPGVYVNFDQYSNKLALFSKCLEDNKELFRWRAKEKVLDAGCGPGGVTARVIQPFLPQDFQVLLGFDVNSKMVEYARATYTSEKVKFFQADFSKDISHILRDHSIVNGFDKIFSILALHFTEDMRKTVKSLWNLLQPGGELFLIVPHISSDYIYKNSRPKEEWKEYFKDVPKETVTRIDIEQFEETLLSEGFEVKKFETMYFNFQMDSKDIMMRMLEANEPYIGCVPPHLKERYLMDIFNELQALGFVMVKDGVVFAHSLNTVVFARKPTA